MSMSKSETVSMFQLPKEFCQFGIIQFVANDETDIDRNLRAVIVDADSKRGIGVEPFG
jgi:hypothetical protein